MHTKVEIKSVEAIPREAVNAITQFVAIFASELSRFDGIQKRLVISWQPIMKAINVTFLFGDKHAEQNPLTTVTSLPIQLANFTFERDSICADYGATDVLVHDFIRRVAQKIRERREYSNYNPKVKSFIGYLVGYKEVST